MEQNVFNFLNQSYNLKEAFIFESFDAEHLEKITSTPTIRRRILRGQSLFNAGDSFSSLYIIRSGSFKTFITDGMGYEQILGFQMTGGVIGLDGIAEEIHRYSATAIEDSDIRSVNYNDLEELLKRNPALQHQMNKLMSSEILRVSHMLMLLGSMTAEERLASFLLDLRNRQHLQGYSQSELQLKMSREEIGFHLGLTLNTVSRIFSRLSAMGIISVSNRYVKILNPAQLHHLVHQHIQS